MEVQLDSTTKIVHIDGVPARVWEGFTASGIPIIAFVTRIAVREEHDQADFERELQECRAPSDDARTFPVRMVL